MRSLFYCFLFLFFLWGCAETPEVPSSKDITAKNQIMTNKTEAQKAQEEYLKLQQQRHSSEEK
jgi:hypothetical protein